MLRVIVSALLKKQQYAVRDARLYAERVGHGCKSSVALFVGDFGFSVFVAIALCVLVVRS